MVRPALSRADSLGDESAVASIELPARRAMKASFALDSSGISQILQLESALDCIMHVCSHCFCFPCPQLEVFRQDVSPGAELEAHGH